MVDTRKQNIPASRGGASHDLNYCTVWTVKSTGASLSVFNREGSIDVSRETVRDRILSAAAEVAREQGAGNLSLDAVAAKAGVSKGGLLYHFPTKAALMKASVEYFVARFEAGLDAASRHGSLLEAFAKLTIEECSKPLPGAAGVLAAMAEDPDFLEPVSAFHRRLLDRLLADTDQTSNALLVYLALEGMRSLKLFEINILTVQEQDLARDALLRLAAHQSG